MSWDRLQREVLEAMGHTVYDVAPPPGDALLQALLRAAGRDADAPDAAALCREWSPATRLRDPAAKRALWPRLRALRASARAR
ncbi:MAG TPA: hypothetical protein VM619_00325 [Luteimonas sp.]|nr:hypothetical protein [Luteimonas sp.]